MLAVNSATPKNPYFISNKHFNQFNQDKWREDEKKTCGTYNFASNYFRLVFLARIPD